MIKLQTRSILANFVSFIESIGARNILYIMAFYRKVVFSLSFVELILWGSDGLTGVANLTKLVLPSF